MIEEKILRLIKKETVNYYKDNLISLCIFGSNARKTATFYSDIDILVVCEKLKKGRLNRVRNFDSVENSLKQEGYNLLLSPIIKTKQEILQGSPLFWDMTEDCLVLYDKDNFFKDYLETLKEKLEVLGAKKVKRRGYWFWILKPDYKPGEVFSV